jgi:hypothetical protein
VNFAPEQEREILEHLRAIEESMSRTAVDIRDMIACCDRIQTMGQKKGPTGEEQ